jgi:hypothetical protein
MRLLIELKQWQRRRAFPWHNSRLPGFLARMVSSILNELKSVVSAPIVGLNSEDRIKETVEAVSVTQTEEEIKHLKEPYVSSPSLVISRLVYRSFDFCKKLIVLSDFVSYRIFPILISPWYHVLICGIL